jgi:hypothetical protein
MPINFVPIRAMFTFFLAIFFSSQERWVDFVLKQPYIEKPIIEMREGIAKGAFSLFMRRERNKEIRASPAGGCT